MTKIKVNTYPTSFTLLGAILITIAIHMGIFLEFPSKLLNNLYWFMTGAVSMSVITQIIFLLLAKIQKNETKN